MRLVYKINQFNKMIACNKPLKLTLGIIIGLVILLMGMKEVTAHSFSKGDSVKVSTPDVLHLLIGRK